MFSKAMFAALVALAMAVAQEEHRQYGLLRSLAHRLRHHDSGHRQHDPNPAIHHQSPSQLHGPQHALHDHAPHHQLPMPYQLHGPHHINEYAPLRHQIHQQHLVLPQRHQLHGPQHINEHVPLRHHGHVHPGGLHDYPQYHQHGHRHHGFVSPHTYFLGVDDPQVWTGHSERGRIEGHGHVEHHADTWYHH